MRRRRLLVAALAALALALPAAAALAAKPAAAPKPVPLLRLPGGIDWGYPSPFAYSRGPGLINVFFLFDSLLWKDSTGKPIPWLAQKWRRSPDGFEYTFRLRKGVRWHDGQPLTSRDVAFTFDYMSSGPGARVPGISTPLTMIKAIATPDDSTVVFRLTERYAPFPITVAGRIPIIPQHVWAGVKDPAHYLDPKALVGTGPYTLAAYSPAQGAYKFVANPRYFLGEPVVRTLELVPSTEWIAALERGIIDAGGPGVEEQVPASTLERFRKDPRFGVLVDHGEWTRALHFNLTKGFPFDNRAFRQAVAYAIDRRDLVKRVLLGSGEPGSLGVVAPGSPFAAEGLPSYPYDPARAKKLLAGIGLVDRNGDGLVELPDGGAFRPELTTSTFQVQTTAEIVARELRAVGLDVQLKTLDRASSDAATASGSYQMALVGYGGLGGDPDSLRQQLSASSSSRSFTRIRGYSDPEFERYAAAQLVTVRPSTRERFVAQLQRVLANDVPLIPLYYPERIWVYRKATFDAWYYTPGGVFGGYPGALNKQAFVTGGKTGV